MILDITPAVLGSTAVMFIVGFVVLFVIYYFTSPFSARFDDRRSRIIYSLVNALYFSIVLSIGIMVMPGLSSSYGIIVALIAALIIIAIFTAVQVYAISELVKRGILRMHSKSSSQPRAEPKGKR